jgi:thiosulfate reductase cytochrome b subunit
MSLAASRQDRRMRINPLILRVTHWVNALAMVIMIGSGWRIYNSDPIVPALIPYFNHRYTLGGDFELSFQLHGEPGLAGALLWHFAGMWLLVINFLVYLTYGIVSGRFRRKLLPLRPVEIWRDLVAALSFKLPHEIGIYNAVQRLLYVGVLAVITLTILSGLAIWKPVQFQELTWLMGGFQSARVIHFLGMAGIVLFVAVHLALVALVPKTLPPMITGYAEPHGDAGD